MPFFASPELLPEKGFHWDENFILLYFFYRPYPWGKPLLLSDVNEGILTLKAYRCACIDKGIGFDSNDIFLSMTVKTSPHYLNKFQNF